MFDIMDLFDEAESFIRNISLGIEITSVIIGLCWFALLIAARWKIYNKAGENGWATIIPFYNSYMMYKITWGNGWLFLLAWICWPLELITRAKLARAFNKKSAFIVGTIFFEGLFTMILGFSSSQYYGIEGSYNADQYDDYKRGLLGLSGQWNGAELCDDAESGYIIGRDPAQCNIVIMGDNDKVSRKHCTIVYDSANDEYVVVDHSSNGTFLDNGTKLDSGVPIALHSGTTLLIGDKSNMFKLL